MRCEGSPSSETILPRIKKFPGYFPRGFPIAKKDIPPLLMVPITFIVYSGFRKEKIYAGWNKSSPFVWN
jgi:hypothetical protein